MQRFDSPRITPAKRAKALSWRKYGHVFFAVAACCLLRILYVQQQHLVDSAPATTSAGRLQKRCTEFVVTAGHAMSGYASVESTHKLACVATLVMQPRQAAACCVCERGSSGYAFAATLQQSEAA